MKGRDAVVAPIRPADPDDDLLVTLRRRDLQSLIREAVADVFSEQRRIGTGLDPEIVGPNEMSRRLSISRTTLHRLRLEGCPAVKLGDCYKFSPPEVLAWLRTRGQP